MQYFHYLPYLHPLLHLIFKQRVLARRILVTLYSMLLPTMLANPRWMSMWQHLILGFSFNNCQHAIGTKRCPWILSCSSLATTLDTHWPILWYLKFHIKSCSPCCLLTPQPNITPRVIGGKWVVFVQWSYLTSCI